MPASLLESQLADQESDPDAMYFGEAFKGICAISSISIWPMQTLTSSHADAMLMADFDAQRFRHSFLAWKDPSN